MTTTQVILAVTIVIATVVGAGVIPRCRPARPGGAGVLRHPGFWLGVVVAGMLVNQVFVTAYIHQAWGGDTSRITRYLPPGWFDLADLGCLEDALPALPWTVLHVQAALELPLVVLAYLLVARWVGPEVASRVMAARWWISASWTATFCLVEWDLHNPYTVGDIVIRVVVGVVVPLLLPALGTGASPPSGLVEVGASAATLAGVILAVYDVLTLYNLGHAGRWAIPVAVALLVLAVARWRAARPSPTPGSLTAAALRTLGWFVVVFAVPALPLRYGLTFGAQIAAVVCGSLLVATSQWLGWDRRRCPALLGVLAVGVLGAAVGAIVTVEMTEVRLLAAATGFVAAAAIACRVGDVRRSDEPASLSGIRAVHAAGRPARRGLARPPRRRTARCADATGGSVGR